MLRAESGLRLKIPIPALNIILIQTSPSFIYYSIVRLWTLATFESELIRNTL